MLHAYSMHMCNKLCMFAFIRWKCLAILKDYKKPFIIKLLVVVEMAFFTEPIIIVLSAFFHYNDTPKLSVSLFFIQVRDRQVYFDISIR